MEQEQRPAVIGFHPTFPRMGVGFLSFPYRRLTFYGWKSSWLRINPVKISVNGWIIPKKSGGKPFTNTHFATADGHRNYILLCVVSLTVCAQEKGKENGTASTQSHQECSRMNLYWHNPILAVVRVGKGKRKEKTANNKGFWFISKPNKCVFDGK